MDTIHQKYDEFEQLFNTFAVDLLKIPVGKAVAP